MSPRPNMYDQQAEDAPAIQAIAARLVTYGPLLIAATFVTAIFAMLGGLRLDLAMVGIGLLLLFVVFLPVRTLTVTKTVEVPVAAPHKPVGSMASVVNALADPALTIDRRGTVILRNDAVGRQYPGMQPGKVLTLGLRNPELIAAIDGALKTGETRSFELHETVPSETWDRVVVAPLQIANVNWFADEERQLLITFQSLTELKRVDAMRSDFIANASHELRTPLASLVGFIDTLLGPAANDSVAREKFLGIMRAQADRMSRLIDDMLSLSRIEMHQHVLPTGSVDLSGLLREVREGLQGIADAAEVEVRLSLPQDAAVTTGDRGQLYEVFENLIDNAIKYGASGKYVDVTLTTVNRLGARYLVSVVDRGVGVEPEQVPRMTERFYRIDAEASRKKKGTGLGLAIVKHIVQRHRGQIAIRSRAAEGEGLRVEIYLP